MKCHFHDSPTDLRASIQNSCNPYYVNVFRRVLELPQYENVRNAYNEWRKYVISFGLGSRLCPDFQNEVNGSIPTQAYYDRVHRTKNWHPLYIISSVDRTGRTVDNPYTDGKYRRNSGKPRILHDSPYRAA